MQTSAPAEMLQSPLHGWNSKKKFKINFVMIYLCKINICTEFTLWYFIFYFSFMLLHKYIHIHFLVTSPSHPEFNKLKLLSTFALLAVQTLQSMRKNLL